MGKPWLKIRWERLAYFHCTTHRGKKNPTKTKSQLRGTSWCRIQAPLSCWVSAELSRALFRKRETTLARKGEGKSSSLPSLFLALLTRSQRWGSHTQAQDSAGGSGQQQVVQAHTCTYTSTTTEISTGLNCFGLSLKWIQTINTNPPQKQYYLENFTPIDF